MQEKNIVDNNMSEDNQEMDIINILFKLWNNKKTIIRCCVLGAAFGLLVGFSVPKKYSTGVILAPEHQQKTNSSVSNIASMMGVNIHNNIDAISVEMFPDVVHSTPFIVDLFDVPVTFERKDSLITTSLLDYMKDYQKTAWWSYIIKAPFKALGWFVGLFVEKQETVGDGNIDPSNLPEKERNVVQFFAENIMVGVDKKSQKTKISLQMQDPMVVAAVMNTIVDNLKIYMTDYRTLKARQDVENLTIICNERRADYHSAQQAYANYLDANKSVIRQSANAERDRLKQEMNLAYEVYSQVAVNLESARIQEQDAKPVFTVIEPVVVPLKKSAPSRAKLLVMYTFLAFCISSFWVLLGKNYWDIIRHKI